MATLLNKLVPHSNSCVWLFNSLCCLVCLFLHPLLSILVAFLVSICPSVIFSYPFSYSTSCIVLSCPLSVGFLLPLGVPCLLLSICLDILPPHSVLLPLPSLLHWLCLSFFVTLSVLYSLPLSSCQTAEQTDTLGADIGLLMETH